MLSKSQAHEDVREKVPKKGEDQVQVPKAGRNVLV